jgi:hypothetical protein
MTVSTALESSRKREQKVTRKASHDMRKLRKNRRGVWVSN